MNEVIAMPAPSCFLQGTFIQYVGTNEEAYVKWLFENGIVNGECWECHLKANAKGYCYVQVCGREGVKWRVHRLVWTVINGPIPDLTSILHSCDNRKCFRPSHLFSGSEADNTADMMIKGRHKYILPDNRKIKDLKELKFMREAGLTYAQLAEHFGVSPSTIMNNLRKANG